jgi:epoxide hydrolase
MALALEPFRIEVPDATLDDLRARLERTRLPNQVDGIGWAQGTEIGSLGNLLDRWRDAYDWRRVEAELGGYEQVRTVVDGQVLHALHARSMSPDAVPLLLVHGWPGSVVEFLDALPRLTETFHVVAPSLPGYGFSGPTHERGWHPRRIAGACVELLAALGYDRYGLQGGDWGSVVTSNVADLVPERVIGLHLNFVVVPRPTDGPEPTAEESAALAALAAWRRDGAAYQEIQGTRPQTLGYALEDSPAGLCAWIVEKFRAWSGGDDAALASFRPDRLLDNVTLYWVTGTATSSTRLYWEMRQAGRAALPERFLDVPTGIACYPAEVSQFPRSWVERRYRVTHWVEQPRGGHFAAMQVPDLFVDDVRAFFDTLH